MPENDPSPLVVAIDGPAGSGKSTLAMRLAEALGWAYLDTGAMYRAVTVRALDAGVSLADAKAVAEVARRASIRLDGRTGAVAIDGRDVTDAIRTARVNDAVSAVAAIPEVRALMVAHQRRFAAENGRIVAEGRDIGTVVFPNASVKVFLDAAPVERARRRTDEMRRKDPALEPSSVRRALDERDRRDTSREVAPLSQAEDAVRIDSTGMPPAKVLDRVLALVRSRVPPTSGR